MVNKDIHAKIERRLRDARDLTKKKEQRIKEIESFKYSNRKYIKLLYSIPFISALALLTNISSLTGYFPIALAPAISVIGGRVIGGLVETYRFNKKNKRNEDALEKFEDYNDEASREKREIQLKVEKEKTKVEEYILEYEFNQTLVDTPEKNSNDVDVDRLSNSKKSSKESLKKINTKIVLAKDYNIYQTKVGATIYHLWKTIGWSLPFGLLYGITTATMTGSLTGLQLLFGFGVGMFYNGCINVDVLRTLLKQYSSYRKESKMKINDENLDTLRQLQREYTEKLGHIELVENYNMSITKFEEKKLNSDPVAKQFDYSLDHYVQQYNENEEEIYNIQNYQKPRTRRRVIKK